MKIPGIWWWFACLGWFLPACGSSLRVAGKKAKTPLEQILALHAADFDSILSHPKQFEVRIIYTQIDRDRNGRPHFTSFTWNADSTRYFYPASMVKLPLALLTLEKINTLRKNGYPSMSRNTPYRIDSIRPFQRFYAIDTTAPGRRPSPAHDIRRIFAVSDNEAYNHLFEFLGREDINRALREKGYRRTGVVRRFFAGGRDNSFSSPITFWDAASPGSVLWKQPELHDTVQWTDPQKGLKKGRGYLDNTGNLIKSPMDFGPHNWFALTDMERMIRAVMFPEALPAAQQFNLTEKDYRFLRHYMGIFPRECDYPKYDSTVFSDGSAKYLVFGDSKKPHSGRVRSFNKIGAAYGTLTDAAYVVDFDAGVEFILVATILCNRDAVFNDDKYEYEETGFPFLAKLGRAVLEYERIRPKAIKPDLQPLLDCLSDF